MGDWDKSMKTLVASCPQAFADLILRQTGVQVREMLSTEFKGYDLEADGLFMAGMRDGEDILVLLEFQSSNDKEMGERLLEYSFRAKSRYKKPVSACVIYLRQDGIVPEPPLVWEFRNGKRNLIFDYTCIKLWEMEAEELLAFGQPVLLPLTLLTKRGANRIIVEEMFEQLLASRQHNLLPVSNLLASLALGEDDREWLNRRYKQMTDILKDAPAYRWMTDDAREEGLEQGLEQGIEQGLERGRREGRLAEREEILAQLREKVVGTVAERFPKLVRFTKKQISDVEETDRLLNLVIELKLATDADAVMRCLVALDEEEPEAQ